MSGVEVVLLVAVLLLAVVVVGAVLFGVRAIRGFRAAPAPEDPAFIAEKDRQEQSLAGRRGA
ncbi:ribonuclease Y, partial [Micromonospora sp. U56]|nr:ribonuclease Y [Micromonospora sp. U56]